MKRSRVFAAVATAGLMVGSQAALAQSVGCGSLPQANAAPAYTTGPGAALAASGGAPRGGGGGGGLGFSGAGRGALGGAGRAGGGGAAVRDPHAAGNVDAKDLPDGENAPNNVDGNFVLGPTHPAAPDTVENASVPKGVVCIFAMESGDSKMYPGITRAPRDPNAPPQPPNSRMIPVMPAPYSRRVYVYIPRQYVAGTVAPFIVGADGPDNGLFTTLDNMIAAKKLPPMIAVSIGNGGGDGPGSERGLEYDTMSAKYAEFVETEVLPLVEKRYGVKLSKDPDARLAMGGSSGGSVSFGMAWFHNDLYHRVLTYSGTYVNQQSPTDPNLPHGAFELEEHLIPAAPAKPIRIWMEVGDRDNGRPGDDTHDWVAANEIMARSLAAKGYHYQFVFARNAGHTDGAVKKQTLPEALEYVWQGYKAK
ncbi:MAG: alpha/beta hydrolase-fold protein [Terriglobia bacterium]